MVLADTGPLYAAIDPDDQYHSRAQRELRELAQGGFTVLLAYPTLLETYTLVRYRLGHATAKSWAGEITAGTVLINPTVEDYGMALTKVIAYPDQAITLFDGVLAVLAERLGHPVWTYDYHFDVMRLPVWRG